MPALNITFTEDEMHELRDAATAADVSLKAYVHAAVLEAASDRKRRVREAARIVALRSVELNRRLA